MIACQIDYQEIYQVFSPLAGEPFAHLLAGGRHATTHWGGAWQAILAAPAQTLEIRQGEVYLDGRVLGGAAEVSPFNVLKDLLIQRRSENSLTCEDLQGLPVPHFQSGAFGHINYEMAALIEPVLNLPTTPPAAGGEQPEMAFGFYDAAALFHEKTQKAFVIGKTPAAISKLQERLNAPSAQDRQALPLANAITSSHDSKTYREAVALCQQHILAGDIFQANISRRLTALWPALDRTRIDLAALLRALQENSAASFGALLQYEQCTILSNSPERFFAVKPEAGKLHIIAEPVKGTRPCHADPEIDKRIAAELLADEKDRAENIMIADLVRNDLSRVCRDHSVQEEKICELRSYAHVHHLVSCISGIIKPELTALDALIASFPCGSITGAPKIRAIEVIAEIEKQPRGIYCGAIGYFDDRGGADFSVPIRTALLQDTPLGLSLAFGAGGGITVLSDPQSEYDETIDKAATFRELTGTVKGVREQS